MNWRSSTSNSEQNQSFDHALWPGQKRIYTRRIGVPPWESGKIVRTADAAELSDDPELEAAYLGRAEAAQ